MGKRCNALPRNKMTARRSNKRMTVKKAKKILSHGTVKGKKLTTKQKKFFGTIASGKATRSSLKRKRKSK